MTNGTWTAEYDLVERGIEATLLIIICSVALVGNISLWMIVIRVNKLRTTSNALILCLSAADLLVSVINMPVIIFAIINGEKATDLFVGEDGRTSACTFLGLVSMMTFVASVMSLGTISLNRYVMICHPGRVRDIFTKRNTGLIIAGVWVLTFLLSMPPLVGWSEYAFRQSQSFCFADWRVDKSYAYFMIAICFGGPFSLMTFSYVNILREVKKSKRRIRSSYSNQTHTTTPKVQTSNFVNRATDLDGSIQEYLPGGTYQDNNNEHLQNPAVGNASTPQNGDHDLKISDVTITTEKEKNNAKTPPKTPASATAEDLASRKLEKHRKEELRLTLSFFVVIVTFVICWLPFVITMFTYMYLPSSRKDNTSGPNRVVDMCTLLLGCLNSSCNPIIYGVMNRNFRAAYKKLFCSSCAFWRASTSRSTSAVANSLTGSNTN